MYHCYIIQSLLNGKFYIGSTDNPRERLEYHNKGLVKSTKPYIPWKIVHYEYFKTRAETIKREKQIKGWKKRLMIIKLISKNKIVNLR